MHNYNTTYTVPEGMVLKGVSTCPQVRKVMVQQWREQQDELRRTREAEAAEARRRAEERRRIELEERQLVNKMKLDLHQQVKVRERLRGTKGDQGRVRVRETKGDQWR